MTDANWFSQAKLDSYKSSGLPSFSFFHSERGNHCGSFRCCVCGAFVKARQKKGNCLRIARLEQHFANAVKEGYQAESHRAVSACVKLTASERIALRERTFQSFLASREKTVVQPRLSFSSPSVPPYSLLAHSSVSASSILWGIVTATSALPFQLADDVFFQLFLHSLSPSIAKVTQRRHQATVVLDLLYVRLRHLQAANRSAEGCWIQHFI